MVNTKKENKTKVVIFLGKKRISVCLKEKQRKRMVTHANGEISINEDFLKLSENTQKVAISHEIGHHVLNKKKIWGISAGYILSRLEFVLLGFVIFPIALLIYSKSNFLEWDISILTLYSFFIFLLTFVSLKWMRDIIADLHTLKYFRGKEIILALDEIFPKKKFYNIITHPPLELRKSIIKDFDSKHQSDSKTK